MIRAFQVAPGPIYASKKPERNRVYLCFVRRFSCAACSSSWAVEAAHTGPHGIGQKSSDKSAIPLCRKCHPKFDRDPRGFAQERDLDIPALIERLHRAFDLRVGGNR